jgi:Arm DNA-binding domain
MQLGKLICGPFHRLPWCNIKPKNAWNSAIFVLSDCSWLHPTAHPIREPKMPQLALTDLSVRALKPSDCQITYWDTNLPNFGVRAGKKVRTFVMLLGTERHRVTLGHYPAMSLSKARQLCRERPAAQTLERTSRGYHHRVRRRPEPLLCYPTHAKITRRAPPGRTLRQPLEWHSAPRRSPYGLPAQVSTKGG